MTIAETAQISAGDDERQLAVEYRKLDELVPYAGSSATGTPSTAWRRIAMICASVHLFFFFQIFLRHLAEKILQMKPLNSGGITIPHYCSAASQRLSSSSAGGDWDHLSERIQPRSL